jgi:hypothetical protein
VRAFTFSRRCSNLVLGFAFMSLVLTEGCRTSVFVRSTLSTTVGKRTVTGSFDGPASVSSVNGVAEFKYGNLKISVNDSAVLLHGTKVVDIPQSSNTISIECKEAALSSVMADGQIIWPRPRAD